MTNNIHSKLLILGSGPAGYTAAIYSARAMLEPTLLTGIEPGGQMTITTDVENYPGFADIIQGPWLMDQMKGQAESVGTNIVFRSIDVKAINKSLKNLSGGQLQRVLIARALAQDSEILLLDEAFSAVDIGAQEDIMQLIDNINLDGKTILIATHDVNNLEEKFDEVLCLNKHCCAYGDPAEVLTPEVIEEMYGSHNTLLNNKTHFNNEGSGND